jgi:integrase
LSSLSDGDVVRIAEAVEAIRRRPKEKKHLKKIRIRAPFKDGLKLLDAAETLRDKLLIRLPLFTALREGEILGADDPRHGKLKPLTTDDLIFGNRCIKVKGKGDTYEFQFLDAETLSMLQTYIQKYRIGKGKPLFTITCRHYQRIVKRLAEKAGVNNAERYSPHVLRAMSITYMSHKKGVGAAKRHARHSAIQTTAIYDRPDDDMVKETYDDVFNK